MGVRYNLEYIPYSSTSSVNSPPAFRIPVRPEVFGTNMSTLVKTLLWEWGLYELAHGNRLEEKLEPSALKFTVLA